MPDQEYKKTHECLQVMLSLIDFFIAYATSQGSFASTICAITLFKG